MKSRLILCAFIGLFMFSCDSGKESLDYATLEATTGLKFMDANGQAIGLWGNPNDFSEGSIVFPNPSNGNLFLSSFDDGIQKIWIVPSICVTDNSSNIEDLASQVAYDQSDLDSQSEMTSEPVGNPLNLTMDLSSISKGTYKVFYLLEGNKLRWTSIYIDASQTNFPDPGAIDFCN